MGNEEAKEEQRKLLQVSAMCAASFFVGKSNLMSAPGAVRNSPEARNSSLLSSSSPLQPTLGYQIDITLIKMQ